MDLRSIIEIVVARVYHTTNLHHSSLRRGYMVVSRQSEPTKKNDHIPNATLCNGKIGRPLLN